MRGISLFCLLHIWRKFCIFATKLRTRMKGIWKRVILTILTVGIFAANGRAEDVRLVYPEPQQVEDPFWTPLMERKNHVTIPDGMDKFEGRGIGKSDQNQGND